MTTDLWEQIISPLVKDGTKLETARRLFDRRYLEAALKANDGNICHTASSIGVHRNTLTRTLNELEIDARSYK